MAQNKNDVGLKVNMRIRLSTRLILFVVLLQVVMFCLLVWNAERVIGENHSTIFESAINNESQFLAKLLTPGLIHNDAASLQDVLGQFKEHNNLIQAVGYQNST